MCPYLCVVTILVITRGNCSCLAGNSEFIERELIAAFTKGVITIQNTSHCQRMKSLVVSFISLIKSLLILSLKSNPRPSLSPSMFKLIVFSSMLKLSGAILGCWKESRANSLQSSSLMSSIAHQPSIIKLIASTRSWGSTLLVSVVIQLPNNFADGADVKGNIRWDCNACMKSKSKVRVFTWFYI